ncbi:DJ-1/PfpI family protein [Streptomyces sp. NPDC049881]|uniref:DJ-1/PfpI family protein n=1 Tax=Streptomyces sp. NPDC049881 TaxID=3155778 RepID=UPI003440F427
MERRNFLQWTATAGAGTVAASAAGATAAENTRRTGPLRVHIVMYDGVEELDYAAPFEVFSAAGMHSEHGVDVRLVTPGNPRLVHGGYGMRVKVAHRWAPELADVIVVPGGGYTRRNGPGIWAEIAEGTLPRALAAAPRPGLIVSSLCTGAIVLAEAGLVQGRPCTTHHGAASELEARGGVLKDARVVDDGDLVTAGGITSGLDLGLWLVRRTLGSDAAVGVENMLEYQARGTVWASVR